MKKLNLSALANKANNPNNQENLNISSEENINEVNLLNNNNLSQKENDSLSENKPKKKIVSLKAIGINNEKKDEDENTHLNTQKDEFTENESLNSENKTTPTIPKISLSLNGSNLNKQTKPLIETESEIIQEAMQLKDQENEKTQTTETIETTEITEIVKENKIKISDGDTVLDFIQTKNSEIFSNYKSSFVAEIPKKEQTAQNADFIIDNTKDNKNTNSVDTNQVESESISIFSTNTQSAQSIINTSQAEDKSEIVVLSDESITVKSEDSTNVNILETEKVEEVISEPIENIEKIEEVISEPIENIEKIEVLETEKIEVKKEIEKKPEINKINTNIEKYQFKKILKSKLFYFSTSFSVMLLIFLGFLGYIKIPGLDNISGINNNLKSNVNENLTLSGELAKNTDENLTLSGEVAENTDENLTLSGEVAENTDENLTLSGEVTENTDENLTLSGEVTENTDENLTLSGETIKVEKYEITDLKLKKYLFKKYIN